MAIGEDPPPLRIGNAERAAALKALDEHLTAGRLGVEEYADRSAAASEAVVAADLEVLFDDLPEPHPPRPGRPGPPPQPRPAPPAPALPRPSGLDRWQPLLMTMAVIITIALVALTRQGAMVMLIPIAAVVLWTARHRRP